MPLQLSDSEVNLLITFSKSLIETCNINLSPVMNGEIMIEAINNPDEKFKLDYFVRPDKVTLNFRECNYNYCIIRLNLNDGFHKNSNGTKVRGNRINLFSEEEFSLKNDGSTYMKAYSLPYSQFEDIRDFEVQLMKLLEYTTTDYHAKLNITGTTLL